MPRDELAEVLWGETTPATWGKALSVLVSKLRGLLTEQGIDGARALTSAFGCYRLELPEGSWVDVVAAVEAGEEAEAALAAGDLEEAKETAALAASLVRQPFLPGDEGAWVEEKRRELGEIRVEALAVLADACLLSGDAREATKWAAQVVELEPFREAGYRRLMEAHVAGGDGAEALRVYERCRRLLAEELGAYPSPETESIYRDLLEAPAGGAAAETRAATSPRGAAPPPASRRKRSTLVTGALVVLVVLVAGGTAIAVVVTRDVGPTAGKSAPTRVSVNPRVAFLLPDNAAPWVGFDNVAFVRAMKKLYSGVSVDVLDAGNNPDTQKLQAENEVTKGARVLVVAAVDGNAFGAVARRAIQQGVKVVAYDRLITGARISAYVSFDSVTVGHTMGVWMRAHTQHGARVAVINGSRTDVNAHYVNTGMLQVFKPLFNSGARKVVGPRNGTWTPGWDPPTAKREIEQLLTENKINAVFSANDGMAASIITALEKRKLAGKVLVTGQDASLKGIQNIIRGYQGMSVFKDIRKEAAAAAAITNALLRGGKKLEGINGRTPNGSDPIPSVIIPVQAVGYTNLSLLVRNGWINLPGIGGLRSVCTNVPRKSICK